MYRNKRGTTSLFISLYTLSLLVNPKFLTNPCVHAEVGGMDEGEG